MLHHSEPPINFDQCSSADTPSAPFDRRGSKRVVSNDLSEILNERGKPICGCIVHNLSKSGAMLEITITDIPKRFLLSNIERKTKAACSIVWQCGGLVGAEFLTQPREL